MAVHFNFAFLGPEHIYVASVTRVSTSGHSIGPSDLACFRVPKFWAQGYDKRASYIFNIRGHDFLSHTGRWKSEEEIKFMKRSEHIINEIDALRLLGEELEKKGHNKADLKLSLGPQPGSFFADAPKLCLYRFENLPRDLNNAIQLNQRKYGQISDVAMNANGGWVMHFRVRTWFNGRDHQFCWGGEEGLPNKLKEALQSGRNRRAKIRHVFLNHQNADEYVLLFDDGYAHVNLHHAFEERIKTLVKTWATKMLDKPLTWDFEYCRCSEAMQRQLDARYYNLRGRFYLSRRSVDFSQLVKNIDLALVYLGEAFLQDPNSIEIRHSLRMTLVAARLWKKDPILEENIANAQTGGVPQATYCNPRDSSAAGIFRNQYLSLIASEQDCREVGVQLRELAQGLNGEWSYSLAFGDNGFLPIKIGPQELADANAQALQELEDSQWALPLRGERQSSAADANAQALQELEDSQVSKRVEPPELELRDEVGFTLERRATELSGLSIHEVS